MDLLTILGCKWKYPLCMQKQGEYYSLCTVLETRRLGVHESGADTLTRCQTRGNLCFRIFPLHYIF